MRQRSKSALVKALRIHAKNHAVCLIRLIIHVLLFLSGNRSSDKVLEVIFFPLLWRHPTSGLFLDHFSYLSCVALHTKYPWHFSLCKDFLLCSAVVPILYHLVPCITSEKSSELVSQLCSRPCQVPPTPKA